MPLPRTLPPRVRPPSAGPWLAWLALTAAIIIGEMSLSPIVGMDTDFWWHLAAGERLFQHGLELRDPFSFTHPQQAWGRIDWLFQALAYAIYQLGGLSAILATRSLVLILSTLLLAKILRRNGASLGVCWCLVLLTACIWSLAVSLRPGTVSMFFTTLFLWLLEEARHGKPRALWALPPLMIVWFNLHVAALGGCLILGVYSVAHLIDCFWLRSKSLDRRWLLVPVMGGLAVFVNPQGWLQVYYPIHFLLVKSAWSQVIVEVQRPSWHSPGTLQCWFLLVLASLGSIQAWRQGHSAGALVTLTFGYLMTSTYRHQFQFCPLLACWAVQPLMKLRDFDRSHQLRWLLLGLSGLWAVRSLFLALPFKLPLAGLLRRETFAEQVADLASRSPQGLKIFTDMNSAGYYIWCTKGQQKVFIDSRGDQVYLKQGFVEAYFEILLGRPHALELLDRFEVEAIANNRLTSAASPLFQEKLPSSDKWVRIYADNTGEFYVRKSLQNQWPTLPGPAPYLESYNQGRHWQDQQQWNRALDAFRASLRAYPQFASAHQALARVYLSQSPPNLARARQSLARAEIFNPHSPGIAEDWARAGRAWPGWARCYFLPFWAL